MEGEDGKTRLSEGMTRIAWSGYCLALAVRSLASDCWSPISTASPGAMKVIEEAKRHEEAYREFHDANGAVLTVLKYYTYLVVNREAIEGNARSMLFATDGRGGFEADRGKMSVRQDLAIFHGLMSNKALVDEISTYVATQIRSGVYDMEMLQEAKKFYDKMEDWI